ncbi:hypothetical protein [Paenibacillus xylanivorans]|uniref:hypothetical protein n=1 Tax=Paenibacillus xylanivorans TaxID=1705561 RepID=UPI001F2661E5|nr:hypothetical protein [Paenibacillus xylanivorans]
MFTNGMLSPKDCDDDVRSHIPDTHKFSKNALKRILNRYLHTVANQPQLNQVTPVKKNFKLTGENPSARNLKPTNLNAIPKQSLERSSALLYNISRTVTYRFSQYGLLHFVMVTPGGDW